jgi:hypothetical protein
MSGRLFEPGEWVEAANDIRAYDNDTVVMAKGAVHQVERLETAPGWIRLAFCPGAVFIFLVGVTWPEGHHAPCQCNFRPIRRNPDLIEGLKQAIKDGISDIQFAPEDAPEEKVE